MGDAKAAGGLFAGWTLKYFDKITAAQATSGNASDEDEFDFNDLGADRRWSPIFRRLWLWSLRVAFAFFRTCWPIPKFGRLVIVTRDADVRDVLAQHDIFRVPYGPEMLELGGGVATFVLGLEGAEQQRQHEIIRGLIGEQDAKWLVQRTRQIADTLIDASEGRIDVMKDLITRVASETCAEFFGLGVDDPDAFAEWSMSISALLFADPFGKPATRKLGLAGAARVRSVIDAALARLSLDSPPLPPEGLDKTILQRLRDVNISDDEIRAIMVGMITGFIPTTTLAAGNIFEELLRKPDGLDAVTAAAKQARSGDDPSARDRLQQLLFEAARLNPALNPGQWRYAAQDGTVTTSSGSHRIAAGSVLLVATASAMRDHQSRGYELVFGSGVHACLGKTLAMAQITAIFEALMSRDEVHVSKGQWGRIFRVGVFPRRLDIAFKPAFGSQTQSMVTVLAPLTAKADLGAWRREIENLTAPATPNIVDALRATNVIHFASLNAIDLGDAITPAPYLLLEVNGDGTSGSLIDAVAASASPWLLNLFRSAANNDTTPAPASTGPSLGELLRVSEIELKARPWGTTGLCFYGLPGLSISSIQQQEELVKFCREAVDCFVQVHAGLGSHATGALRFVRDLIHGDPKLRGMRSHGIPSLVERGPAFRRYLTIPSRQEPPTLCWTKPDSRLGAVLSSPTLFPLYGLLGVIALAVSVLCFWWFDFSLFSSALWIVLGQCLIALVAGGIGTATLVGIVVGVFATLLHRADVNDRPEDLDPNIVKVREIAKRENDPNCEQNHFLSVSPLKPGWFRKLTLGIALWGIELVVGRAFRPGYIVNMGTIHFARWFRPPGSERLVFLSNYDGSWESYLEDFVTKAYLGQNAAWSNAVGYPRTKWLVNDGAQDGDRFKRWVRRQQQPTQFWFNRLSHLTADQMRNNAVISWELARATTDSQARAWLSYFGSTPRTDTVIETEEVQAVVFRGFKRLPYMKFAAIRLPDDRETCANWLASLVPGVESPHTITDVSSLDDRLKVSFGDRPLTGEGEQWATCVAFTAAGLAHLKLPKCDDHDPTMVATFPAAFNLGMSSRQRVLGDYAESQPSDWRWADSDHGKAAHLALLLYGKTQADCDTLFELHRSKLAGAGLAVTELDTQPTDKGINYEHFGFRDGISQPVIRGTQRFARGAQPRDIMAPGEFLLGYQSNQGYYPPTPVVPRDSDTRNYLGSIPAPADSRFSAFQDPRPQVRDFGRNGSFLAIRQLEQHVDKFHDYADRCVKDLMKNTEDLLPDLIGGDVTRDWVEAKMMGRWRDGVPLIDRPIGPVPPEPACDESVDEADHADPPCKHAHRQNRLEKDTDLNFGVDDPQGLYCPFGAHIRRVNPRGSLAPGDDSQLMITNRHRLLRRGRSYQQHGEKGLLFIGLCADLERQFEFIQQSWLGSTSFAGLTNEPDPIVSVKPPGASTRFTIPTSAGSLALPGPESFVTVHGGGYFFLPSRSALMFLVESNRRLLAD